MHADEVPNDEIAPPGWTTPRARAHYAAGLAANTTRATAEAACPMRSPFQRDRDRVLHSTAFRRLTYKTQVFIFHEGDHYRTRLTHTLEVAQIARALARMLGLDEDLAEALALAHDLGHPPFGHAGERALNAVMAPFGGFDHNAQSLRIVAALERKYASFDGLNLTFETLEGLAKHNGPLVDAQGLPRGIDSQGAGQRALVATIAELGLSQHLALNHHASLEAQVASLADDIAYYNHDLDDGLRAGLIALDDLDGIAITQPLIAAARTAAAKGTNEHQRIIYEVNRRLITHLIEVAVQETRTRLAIVDPMTIADIKSAGTTLAAFPTATLAGMAELKAFLSAHVWRHPKVVAIMRDAEGVIAQLLTHYMAEPHDIPRPWGRDLERQPIEIRARRVTDFVAGMTDRFAMEEHRRLFDATPPLR